jgi:hypothetical protein
LEKRSRAGSKTQEPTQTIRPPLESKPYDLETIIEQRIREARLARQRKKEAQQEVDDREMHDEEEEEEVDDDAEACTTVKVEPIG